MILEIGNGWLPARGPLASLRDVERQLDEQLAAGRLQWNWRGCFLTEAEALEMDPGPGPQDVWVVIESSALYVQLAVDTLRAGAGARLRAQLAVTLEDK